VAWVDVLLALIGVMLEELMTCFSMAQIAKNSEFSEV
jgi:hypothetical protein